MFVIEEFTLPPAKLPSENRMRAISVQIAAAVTFSNVAATEFACGRVQQAHALVKKMRHVAEVVRRHLGEPNHVPLNQMERLRAELAHLESRITTVERGTRA
jgi:hypothetical protein